MNKLCINLKQETENEILKREINITCICNNKIKIFFKTKENESKSQH